MSEVPDTFKERCYTLRDALRAVSEEVKGLHLSPIFMIDPTDEGYDLDEMHANITLAYRHLEDARMRLGKAVQAYDGGASVYPR